MNAEEKYEYECGMTRMFTESEVVHLEHCTLPEGHDGPHGWDLK